MFEIADTGILTLYVHARQWEIGMSDEIRTAFRQLRLVKIDKIISLNNSPRDTST